MDATIQSIGDRQGTTKKLRDKDFAERSGELSGAICLKTLVLLGNDPVTPWNCSDNSSLVLFVQAFGFVSPSWLLKVEAPKQSLSIRLCHGFSEICLAERFVSDHCMANTHTHTHTRTHTHKPWLGPLGLRSI